MSVQRRPFSSRSIYLSFVLVILLFLVLVSTSISLRAQNPNVFTIEDLVGRWERWPEKRDEKGIWLYTYIRKDTGTSVLVDLKLSDFEQNEFGPMKPGGRFSFSGNFNSDGFDVKVECSTKSLCFPSKYISTSPEKTSPDVIPRQLRSAADISVPYRYSIKPLSKDLLLVTAYTPRYTVGDKIFTAADPEAIVRQFYLTRNDTCEKSKEVVRREIIDGEFGDRFIVALGPPKPMPVGTIIEEGRPIPKEIFRFDKPGCFFLVDTVPSAMFSHPVLYLYVDEESQSILGRKWATFAPIINVPGGRSDVARRPYDTSEQRFSSPDLVFPSKELDAGRIIKEAPIRPLMEGFTPDITAFHGFRPLGKSGEFISVSFDRPVSRRAPPCARERKVAVVVNGDGGLEKGLQENVSRMELLYRYAGFDDVLTLTSERHSLDEVREIIEKTSKDLNECDLFVLYLTGHGYEYTIQNSKLVSNGELVFRRESVVNGQTLDGLPWSVFNKRSNPQSSLGGIDSGSGILSVVSQVKAGHIQLILDYCFSGSIIYAALFPEWGGPAIADSLAPNQTISIITAGRADEAVLFANTDDYSMSGWLTRGDTWTSGGQFTSIFAKYLRAELAGKRPVTKRDYEVAWKSAYGDTKDQFEGPIDDRIRLPLLGLERIWNAVIARKRFQKPQMCEIQGGINKCQ